jgi:hypothetical protein
MVTVIEERKPVATDRAEDITAARSEAQPALGVYSTSERG